MCGFSVDSDQEGLYCRDRESSYELFHIGIVHKLFWLSANPYPLPSVVTEMFTRTWAENRAEYDRFYEAMMTNWDSFDDLLEYCTRHRSPPFPLWFSPSDTVEESNRERFSARLRQELLERYKNKCQVCQALITGSFDAHHIIPRTFGGATTLSNLVPLHAECHKW